MVVLFVGFETFLISGEFADRLETQIIIPKTKFGEVNFAEYGAFKFCLIKKAIKLFFTCSRM